VSQDLVPEMCVGCPECHAADEGHSPFVYSIEDPVEYHIAQVPQVPIQGNFDSAQCIRALMQADPDVIILGSVRRPVPGSQAVSDKAPEQ